MITLDKEPTHGEARRLRMLAREYRRRARYERRWGYDTRAARLEVRAREYEQQATKERT